MEFDIKELQKYSADVFDLASQTLPKECKKAIKDESKKLLKIQKENFSSVYLGKGIEKKEILKKFKSGRVYNRNGSFACRSYNGHKLGHLINNGYIHKGGFKEKNGKESLVEGHRFIEKSESQFGSQFETDIENFLDDLLKRTI